MAQDYITPQLIPERLSKQIGDIHRALKTEYAIPNILHALATLDAQYFTKLITLIGNERNLMNFVMISPPIFGTKDASVSASFPLGKQSRLVNESVFVKHFTKYFAEYISSLDEDLFRDSIQAYMSKSLDQEYVDEFYAATMIMRKLSTLVAQKYSGKYAAALHTIMYLSKEEDVRAHTYISSNADKLSQILSPYQISIEIEEIPLLFAMAVFMPITHITGTQTAEESIAEQTPNLTGKLGEIDENSQVADEIMNNPRFEHNHKLINRINEVLGSGYGTNYVFQFSAARIATQLLLDHDLNIGSSEQEQAELVSAIVEAMSSFSKASIDAMSVLLNNIADTSRGNTVTIEGLSELIYHLICFVRDETTLRSFTKLFIENSDQINNDRISKIHKKYAEYYAMYRDRLLMNNQFDFRGMQVKEVVDLIKFVRSLLEQMNTLHVELVGTRRRVNCPQTLVTMEDESNDKHKSVNGIDYIQQIHRHLLDVAIKMHMNRSANTEA